MALHRFAIVLAISTFLLVIAGASVTSNQAGLSVPDWPLSYGQVMPEMKGGVFYEHGHRMIASFVGFLTVIMAVWLWRTEDRPWMKRLGLAALAAVILQGVLGGMTVIFLLPKAVSISHACLAQIFFSTTIAIAVFTSPDWRQHTATIEDSGWPSLRSLAIVVPLLVLVQIALGAAFRHKALGILPHVGGAVVIGTILLMFAVFVIVQSPGNRALASAAWHLLGITIMQLLLGVLAYFARANSAGLLNPDTLTIVSTVVHVAFGALTMGASVLLALQVWHHVRPRTAEIHSGSLPAATR